MGAGSPSAMSMDQLYLFLQQMMLQQGGGNLGSLMNASYGGFPMQSPSFGGGDGSSSFTPNVGSLGNFLGGGAGGASFPSFGGGMGSLPSTAGSMGGQAFGSPSFSSPLGGSSFSPSFGSAMASSPSSFSGGLGGLTAPNVTGASGRVATANDILGLHEAGRIGLRADQVSGVKDNASSLHSITQAAAGLPSQTSAYGHAKGPTNLDGRMLDAMKSLADKYSFDVSSIAGGKHSPNSRHYAGLAFDVNTINGKPVNANHPDVKSFMADAKALGATEVLGPGAKGHSGHVHVGFDRQNAVNGPYTEAEIAEQNKNVEAAKDAVAAAETPEEAMEAAGKVDESVDTRSEAIQDAQQADQEAKDAKDAEEGKESETSDTGESQTEASETSSEASSDSRSSESDTDSGSSGSSSSGSDSSSDSSSSGSTDSSSSGGSSESSGSSGSGSSGGSSSSGGSDSGGGSSGGSGGDSKS